MGLRSLITLSLQIHEEQLENKGEDAALQITYMPNAAILCCMDGCGGAGACSYAKAAGATGARLSAMHTGVAISKWFLDKQYGWKGTEEMAPDELIAEMKAAIDIELSKKYESVREVETVLKSRLARVFPTTLAGFLLGVEERNCIRYVAFWAGDSRAFLMRHSGLVQLSRDDIRGGADPFAALENDSRLTNLVSVDSPYVIHTKTALITEPCIVLTATDGCFSYLNSPLEFEWILLDTLRKADTPVQWEEALREALRIRAEDDFTMNIAVIGFQNWSALKTAYCMRYAEFVQEYYSLLQEAINTQNREAHYSLWLRYKESYYG